jgi:hypothetical protein
MSDSGQAGELILWPDSESMDGTLHFGKSLGALERDVISEVFADWRDRLTFDMEEVEAQAADEEVEEIVEVEEGVEVEVLR